jgi:hypothetical protein
MRPKKQSPKEVEALMVPKLIEALYPVFYPIEQQDGQIQLEHYIKVKAVALIAWRQFTS